jgi:hypothetical protein
MAALTATGRWFLRVALLVPVLACLQPDQVAAADKPARDGLGIRLPAALSAAAIVDLLVPAEDRRAANLIGAKPWPARAGTYVAIVCAGGAKLDPDLPRCEEGAYLAPAPPLRVYLGVLEAKPGAAPRLLARAGPIADDVDWDHTNLPGPGAIGNAEGGLKPQSFERFDLAPYGIAAGQPAFGLRGRWDEAYAGGLAVYTALYLFAIVGGQLRQVLAVPISAFEDLPGSRPGGTRNRTDEKNVVVVSQRMTDGYFDLIVRDASGRWHQSYRWSKADAAYRPAGS